MPVLCVEEEVQDKKTEGVVPGVPTDPHDRPFAGRSKGNQVVLVE